MQYHSNVSFIATSPRDSKSIRFGPLGQDDIVGQNQTSLSTKNSLTTNADFHQLRSRLLRRQHFVGVPVSAGASTSLLRQSLDMFYTGRD
jgi:hypothetical protein